MRRNLFLIFILIFFFLPKIVNLWPEPIFVSCLYIMIGIFILMEGNSLYEYNIDSYSIVLFILFGTIFRYDKVANDNLSLLFKIIVWVISTLLLVRIISGKIPRLHFSKGTTTWILIGLATGVLAAIIAAYLTVHKPGFQIESVDVSQYTSMNFIIRTLALLGSHAAVPEEFIFRGLLWGYLAKLWNDNNKACLAQGLIFWLFHFDRIFASPIVFWVIVPFETALFSFLVWRSRSLAPSVIAYTVSTTLHIIFAIVMASN